MGALHRMNRSSGGRNRVTINDVAEALGVTKSTVSRALNSYSDIAPATRLRVQRMAETMGYRPLSHAQAIRTGRARSIGLVLQTNLHDAHRPFLSQFLAGVTQEASHEGWTLSVATADSGDEVLETFERLVDERKVDGFILPRTLTQDDRVQMLRRLDVPFVLFGRTGDPDGCAWYDILGEEAMRDGVLHMARLGHRRIAYLGGQLGYHYAHLREDGYRAGLEAADLGLDRDLICPDAASRASGADAARRLLDLPDPPTAFVAAVDLGALGIYDAAAERGLRVGRDLSVLGYDGSPEGAYANPPLSTFSVDTQLAGARLASLLLRRIRGEAAETLRETGQATLLLRGSDAKKSTIPMGELT